MADKTPAYHSVYENTSAMMISNVSQWKPSWAQHNVFEKPFATKEGTKHRGNRSTNNNTRGGSRANTSVYNGLLTAPNANTINYCAIFESRSVAPTVGICFIDPQMSSLRVSEIPDSPTFVRTIHKINVHSDSDNLHLLLPLSYQKRKSNIVKILEANLPENATLYFIPDGAFKAKDESFEYICSNLMESEKEAFKIELRHKKFGFSATCACIAYIKSLTNSPFTHERFNVKFESSEDSMFVSTSAINDLELIESNTPQGSGKGWSLFKFLNCTTTKMGERLLKNNIRQPLTNKSSLLLRYEAVKELISDDGIVLDIVTEMKGMVDLDNLFSYLCKKAVNDIDSVSDQKINYVLLLKSVLTTVLTVRDILKPLESKLMKEINVTFDNEDVDAALDLISTYINDDCVWVNRPVELRNQKCYAVKVGQNGILDASRQLYKTLVDEILQEIENLSEKYDVTLENRYDKNRGFYIVIKDVNTTIFEGFEDHNFINIVQRGKNVECITMDIVKLNLRVDSVLDEIFLMTEDTVEELLSKCRKYIPSFFLISEAFAVLDLICSFATKILKPQYETYTCPEFDEKNVAFKNSRHPLLEHIYTSNKNGQDKVISNDVTIVSETSRIQIITGPNMSGKSIYIKQFALNVILAQIGMFVPAEFASTRIFKSLFTRLSNDVNEPNMSTFSMEMVEMADILNHADKDSLIIVDELGRGTGYNDSMALCLSIIEQIRSLKSVCLFVTHFVGIPKIFQNKPGVFELHMGVANEEAAEANFKITPGINWVTGYGIKMIETKRIFPESIIEEAKIISSKLKVANDSSMIESELQSKRNRQTKLILNCYEMLNHIVHNVPESELYETLAGLENEFIEKYDPEVSVESNNDDINDDLTNSTNETEISGVFAKMHRQHQGGDHILDDLLDFGY